LLEEKEAEFDSQGSEQEIRKDGGDKGYASLIHGSFQHQKYPSGK